jgi:uncharacterized protein YjbI with pentapeptide repeats
MNELENQSSVPLRPTLNDQSAWQLYWEGIGQPWRREPEIDLKRQESLAECRSITPNIKQSIYPFKDMKLNRADIEWLLATHDSGRGPIDWNDNHDRGRKGLDLRGADLRQVDLSDLPMSNMCGSLTSEEFDTVTVEQFGIARIHLERAYLRNTHLEGSILYGVHLDQANLLGVHLEKAELAWVHLERVILRQAHLEGANLSNAYFNSVTNLDKAILANSFYGAAQLADVHWDGVNLAVVDWEHIKMTGDEQEALRAKTLDGKTKEKARRLNEFEEAIRANRQLAIILQNHGLNEIATHFIYRAQVLRRWLLWRRKKFGQYMFSLIFDLLAGYGYRPFRGFLAYLIVIFGFMGLYLLNAHFVAPHLSWDEALVLSVSSFHGRGFFTPDITLGDTYARLAAIEAVLGLLIEVSFIATFTQRFFGK